MEAGEYACLYHKGNMQSQEKAFVRMMEQLSACGRRLCGHVYAYDQMNYVLGEQGDAFIVKYVVRVEGN